jgi:hypothetical protein
VDAPLVILVVLVYLFLKSFGLNPVVGDENIWYYCAGLMRDGFLPYRDFFFAHPPLHIVPGWLFLLVAGDVEFTTLKALPLSATVASGVCVYAMARRAAGVTGAVSACALFLLSYDLLRASSHWTGVNWATAWATAGMLAAWRGRGALAGVLLACGVCTGVYVLPIGVVVTAFLFVGNPRAGLRAAIAATATWAAVNGTFWALGGDAYIEQVYGYHLAKPGAEESGFLDLLPRLLFHNFFLLAAPLYALPVLLVAAFRALDASHFRLSWRSLCDFRAHPFVATGAGTLAVWLAYLVFLTRLSRFFDYYIVPVLPAAAVSGGIFASAFFTALARVLRRRSETSPPPVAPAVVSAALMAFLVLLGFITYPRFYRLEGNSFDFPVSPLPDWLQAPLRALWTGERKAGERYSGIRFYLWHVSRHFYTGERIAAYLAANAREGETLFGDSGTTPLVSSLAGVPIVDRFVDTNSMRFECGLPSAEEAVAQLTRALEREDERLTWLLLRPGRGVGSRTNRDLAPLRELFTKSFRPVQTFDDPHHGTYVLLVRKDRA